MAQWSKNRVLPSQINDGNEYTINDDLSLEAINAIVNNSLYASEQTVQVSTMPTASQDYLNKIVQYTGTTDSTYTNGYFYKCVENSGTYSWIQINIQSNNVTSVNNKTGAVVLDADDIDDTNTDNKFVSSTDISKWNAKSTVSAGDSGSSTTRAKYITIDGSEYLIDSSSIAKLQSLPTATANSPDFVNIISGTNDGKLYRKKASTNWDDTTLVGTTLRFNFEYILSSTSPVGQYGTITFNITFETNNGETDVTYNSMTINGPMPQSGQLIYGGDMIIDQVGGWGVNSNYRTITITGGTDATSSGTNFSSLLNWLKNLESQGYATIVKYPSETYEYVEIQNAITSSNKLSADLLQDGSTNKVFTGTEQIKLAGIESGAEVNDITDVQVNGTSVVTNKIANVTVPTVVANPTLAGTESDLTGLQVGNVKYKVPSGGSSSGVSSLGGATGDITLGSGLTMSGNTLSATGGGAGISQSEVINRPNALPVASASSPDFVQVDGVTYQKKVSSGVPSTITDLTGTSWILLDNASPNLTSITYSVNFVSNNTNYTQIGFSYEREGHGSSRETYSYLYYNTTLVLTEYVEGYIFTWENNAYKTIVFDSVDAGTDATNTDLINWLQANATMQPTTIYEYVKVVNDNELIQNKQPLTTPTASSPDFIQINGQVYYKKVTENITSLAGSTWIFNDDLGDLPTEQFNINFSSNSTNYDGIRITTSTMLYGIAAADTVYYQDVWQNNSYKTISIVDGTDIADSDLIDWLKANASRQSGGTVTISYEYAKVSEGGSSGGSDNYSETEIVIGTWIDGKPIYRKTIKVENTTIGNSNAGVAHNISNLDTCIKCLAFMKTTQAGNSWYGTTWLPNDICGIKRVDDTEIRFYNNGDNFGAQTYRTWYFTLDYTKTTD